MQNALIKLREYYPHAHATEKAIVRFILDNPEETADLTVHELAKRSYASASTAIRLCKRLGFKGYKDFIHSLIYELAMRKKTPQEDESEITKGDSVKEIADKITRKNILSLEDTLNLLDYDVVDKTVDLLMKADNICAFGLGSSFNVARDLQQKLLRLNKHITIAEDWHVQWLTARNMTSQDLGIAISYSGKTQEIIRCIESMKENRVPTVSITRYGSSAIADLCDYNLFIAANESIFRSGAMSSRMAQLSVVDILYTTYANRQYETSLKMIARTHIRKEKD